MTVQYSTELDTITRSHLRQMSDRLRGVSSHNQTGNLSTTTLTALSQILTMPQAISSQSKVTICHTERIFPSDPDVPSSERIIPLSLLDATTSNLGLTSAIWLFSSSSTAIPEDVGHNDFNKVANYLRQSLQVALNAYPQWCGQIKAITTLDENELPTETKGFPPHARRFGRLYSHFNTPDDPGVELITATSSLTVESLYPSNRTKDSPIWMDETKSFPLKLFCPSTAIANMLVPHNFTQNGLINPTLAIQITELSRKDGGDDGFVLAAKAAHPMADLTGLVQFIKNWAALNRFMLTPSQPLVPIPVKPVFDPSLLDSRPAGDINAVKPDPSVANEAQDLAFHRFDTWMPGNYYPKDWPSHVPPAFKTQLASGQLKPAGNPMPWSEWDVTAPVSTAVIHFTRKQVELLYQNARATDTARSSSNQEQTLKPKEKHQISKHDALLSHIWTRIIAARNLPPTDHNPVHCNLTLGVRPALNLPPTFQGSPIIMVNIASTPSDILTNSMTSPTNHGSHTKTTNLIRSTLSNITNDKAILPTYLHSLAYESSPQRIWQAFLGRRHIIVTTWAKAGIYDVDFGLGHGPARYADGDLPAVDGFVMIKEAPPPPNFSSSGTRDVVDGVCSRGPWTGNGVDVLVNLQTEDMERLLGDGLLLPVLNS